MAPPPASRTADPFPRNCSAGSTQPTMHLKDGTPARPGDIIKTDGGLIGCIIGGNVDSDACNLDVITFSDPSRDWGAVSSFCGAVRNNTGKVLERTAVRVQSVSAIQSKLCERIGHVDIGNG